jgi:hypothetical protein
VKQVSKIGNVLTLADGWTRLLAGEWVDAAPGQ